MSHLTGYVEAQVALVKLEVREEVAKILARGLVVGVALLFAFLFLLFFSIGLAHYINSLFDEPFVGYWVVAGIYGLPCIAFFVFRKRISKKIENTFSEMIKHKENHHR
jgi:uncharacterized membrane protein YqjE